MTGACLLTARQLPATRAELPARSARARHVGAGAMVRLKRVSASPQRDFILPSAALAQETLGVPDTFAQQGLPS